MNCLAKQHPGEREAHFNQPACFTPPPGHVALSGVMLGVCDLLKDEGGMLIPV